MPANGRWDLIRRLKVNICLCERNMEFRAMGEYGNIEGKKETTTTGKCDATVTMRKWMMWRRKRT